MEIFFSNTLILHPKNYTYFHEFFRALCVKTWMWSETCKQNIIDNNNGVYVYVWMSWFNNIYQSCDHLSPPFCVRKILFSMNEFWSRWAVPPPVLFSISSLSNQVVTSSLCDYCFGSWSAIYKGNFWSSHNLTS